MFFEWWFWFAIAVGSVLIVLVMSAMLLSDRAPSFKLRGKRAIITGGSSGIGLATAKMLVRSGCSVCILARNQERLSAAEAEITACATNGAQVFGIPTDVCSADAVQTAVDQAATRFGGGVDILITSAGLSRPGNFMELALRDFEQLMQANYLGTVYATRAVIPYMSKQKSGRVIFISSMAGLAGVFGFSAYSPSKFAVRGLAEVLHMEYRHHNIFFSVCNPPDVDTPMLHEENKVKPEECRLISEGAGLFTADQIAQNILACLSSWQFFVSNGLDGYVLSRLSAGMAPSSGFFSNLVELLFSGILRLVALVYLVMYRSICTRCARKRAHTDSSQRQKRA